MTCSVLLSILGAVEGGLCLPEVFEMLEVPEVMRYVLLYILEAVEGRLFLLGGAGAVGGAGSAGGARGDTLCASLYAGGDALCATLYAGGAGGDARCARLGTLYA